jgi:hypothetical protein
MVGPGTDSPGAGESGTGSEGAPPRPDHLLRQAVLAVSVLDDVDLDPSATGVRLTGPRAVTVRWSTLRAVLAGADPGSATGRRRLSTWLRLRRRVMTLGAQAAAVLEESARALALPSGHVDHPGDAWVAEAVLGGEVQLGVGVLGLLEDPDEVVPLHPAVAAAAGVSSVRWWERLRGHADAMGALAAHRLARDAGAGRSSVLRPVGGCDVPTLLASPTLRRYLADGDGSGMRALAVPMRSRGWYDLARIDPAFVGAAWSATPEPERGFCRPLLVTADEVTMAVAIGDPASAALADPAGDAPRLRDVRYR